MRTGLKNGMAATLVVIGVALAGCGGDDEQTAAQANDGGKVVKMKIASSSPADYFQVKSAQEFGKRAEELANGKLKVEVYPDGQLGSAADAVQGLRTGSIEAYIGSTSSATELVPEFEVLDFPYLFESYEHYFKVMDGELGKQMADEARAKGVDVLEWWAGGVRDVYNNGRPIHAPADMKGMKLRVNESPVYVATFKAFGAIPTPLDFPEVQLGLQQGVIDGAETALTVAVSSKQMESVDYASLTHHQYTSAMFAVGQKWFDNLDPEIQQAIETAADEVTPDERKADDQVLADAVAAFKAAGKEVVEPDRAAFEAIAAKVREQFAEKFPPETFETIASEAP